MSTYQTTDSSKTGMKVLKIKKDFSNIYTRKNPYDYLKEMQRVGYFIPDLTKPLYRYVADKLFSKLNREIHILDIGSSYAINSSLLVFDLTLSKLEKFFRTKEKVKTSNQSKTFFDAYPISRPNFKFYLIDTSFPALQYAERMDLCKEGYCVNLESDKLPSSLAARLGQIDLIISTGCVGYIGSKSFKKIFSAIKNSITKHNEDVNYPLFAFSVMRIFPIDEIKQVLDDNEYLLLKKTSPIKQREFYNTKEAKEVIDTLEKKGIKTQSLEKNGYYYANFYITGPSKQKSELTNLMAGINKI